MDKQEYITHLRRGLKRLPKEETDKIVDYYIEYFDEAGEEHTQEVITDLGDPKELASKIIAELAIKYINQPDKPIKGKFNGVKLSILSVCAAPIALPLALAAIITILALAFAGFMLYLSLWLAAIATAGSGVIGFVIGIISLFTHFGTGLAILGFSFLTIGIGTFLVYYGFRLGKWLLVKLSALFTKMLKRRVSK